MSVQGGRTDRLVGVTGGLDRWAQEAFHVLVETASHYNATITSADLAEEVQARSHLRTTVAPRSWVPKVLEVVVGACQQGGMPPLTSLVVGAKDGRVGNGYDAVLRAAGHAPIDDDHEREVHAAAARLECYRRYCDDVPEDAEPTLVHVDRPARRTAAPRATTARAAAPRKAASASRATSAARPEPAPLPVCPRCFTQLPAAGGECSYCA